MEKRNAMKVATFNVNGVNGRLPVLLRWLAEAAPDIVCLQELKAPREKFPVAAIRDAGYGAIWHGQKSWNAEQRRSTRGGQPRYSALAIATELTTPRLAPSRCCKRSAPSGTAP
jgi:endonuclease/exonuclease/phosphatase family metal-dependent hydrolase